MNPDDNTENWQKGTFVPKKKVYYYRNNHGKIVSLDEDIAFEQHNQHPKYYGNSDDLFKSGWNYLEAMAAHLEKNCANPTLPRDNRKVGNGQKAQAPNQVSETDVLAYILKNKDQIKELLK